MDSWLLSGSGVGILSIPVYHINNFHGTVCCTGVCVYITSKGALAQLVRWQLVRCSTNNSLQQSRSCINDACFSLTTKESDRARPKSHLWTRKCDESSPFDRLPDGRQREAALRNLEENRRKGNEERRLDMGAAWPDGNRQKSMALSVRGFMYIDARDGLTNGGHWPVSTLPVTILS